MTASVEQKDDRLIRLVREVAAELLTWTGADSLAAYLEYLRSTE